MPHADQIRIRQTAFCRQTESCPAGHLASHKAADQDDHACFEKRGRIERAQGQQKEVAAKEKRRHGDDGAFTWEPAKVLCLDGATMSLDQYFELVNLSDFTRWIDNGFTTDLLPVMPPGADISPFSRVDEKQLGKMPGLYDGDGWVPYLKWTERTMTAERLHQTLAATGGEMNLGLKANEFHALDFDNGSEEFAEIAQEALAELGKFTFGNRHSRQVRWATPFRLAAPCRKMRFHFRHMLDDTAVLVEVLSAGQFYNVAGIHPGTLKPYYWQIGSSERLLPETRRDSCPVMPLEMLTDWLARFSGRLAASGWTLDRKSGEGRPAFPGASLAAGAGDLAPNDEALSAVMAFLPNTPEHDRDYDQWMAICHALAGASGKSQHGFDLWVDHCLQWGDATAEDAVQVATVKWESVDLATVKTGYRFLCRLAVRENPNAALLLAAADFADVDPTPEEIEADNPFVNPVSLRPSFESIAGMVDLMDQGANIEEAMPVLDAIARGRLSEGYATEVYLLLRAKIGAKLTEAKFTRWLREARMRVRGLPLDISGRMVMLADRAFGLHNIGYQGDTPYFFRGGYWQKQDRNHFTRYFLNRIARDDSLTVDNRGGRTDSVRIAHIGNENLQTKLAKRFAPLDDLAFAARARFPAKNCTIVFEPNGEVLAVSPDRNDLLTFQCPYEFDPADFKRDPWDLAPNFMTLLYETVSQSFFEIGSDDARYEGLSAQCKRIHATQEKPFQPVKGGAVYWMEGRTLFALDKADNARMILECLGACLSPDRSHAQFVIFQGQSRTGKSALLATLRRFLPEAEGSYQAEYFTGKYALPEIKGKRLVLEDDTSSDFVLPDDFIKRCTASTVLRGEEKYEKGTTKVPVTAMLFFLCNNPVKCKDQSDAILDRMIYVTFRRKFVESDWVNNPYEAKIWNDESEMRGILAILVQACARVIRNRRIQESEAAKATKRDWVNANSPVRDFIIDNTTEQKPDNKQSDGEEILILHRTLLKWCEAKGDRYARMTQTEFATFLQMQGYTLYRSHTGRQAVRGLWLTDTVQYLSPDFFDT